MVPTLSARGGCGHRGSLGWKPQEGAAAGTGNDRLQQLSRGLQAFPRHQGGCPGRGAGGRRFWPVVMEVEDRPSLKAWEGGGDQSWDRWGERRKE